MANVDHINAFNRKIKLLVQDLKRRTPNDPNVYRMAERVNTAIGVSPVQFANTVGEVLYIIRDEIRAADEEYFLSQDYETILAGGGYAPESVDIGTNLIPIIKNQWAQLSSDEKVDYIDLVQGALDDYILSHS